MLAPADEVRLAFKGGGVIQSIAVEQGAVIRKGQLLATLADQPLGALKRLSQREHFVGPEFQDAAYADQALPIACGQTISQPYVVAYMTEQLDPQGTDNSAAYWAGSAVGGVLGYAVTYSGLSRRAVSRATESSSGAWRVEIAPEGVMAALGRPIGHGAANDDRAVPVLARVSCRF